VRNPFLEGFWWKIHGRSIRPSCEASQLRWEPFLETDARPRLWICFELYWRCKWMNKWIYNGYIMDI
jgi:hypothetical protein